MGGPEGRVLPASFHPAPPSTIKTSASRIQRANKLRCFSTGSTGLSVEGLFVCSVSIGVVASFRTQSQKSAFLALARSRFVTECNGSRFIYDKDSGAILARSGYNIGEAVSRESKMVKILAVDDDVKLCAMLDDYLSRHDMRLTARHTGPDGLEEALHGAGYDLVLLDVMLPGIDGFEVLRRLRADSTIPVLLLTARGEDVDRIVGLEIGADDYLPKPFNPRELVARIHAILRRGPPQPHGGAPNQLVSGSVRFDTAARIASIAGQPLDLTDLEYLLFLTLAERAGEIVSRDELAAKVLERELHAFDRSVDMNISRLRRKLEAVKGFTGVIRTVRYAGYLYTPERNALHAGGELP
jgi:two-component system response regulator CpxR